MAKKQFIRHLEFYGFPDQNKYAGFGDIDLSDIHEKDKEQDDDLKKLSGAVETIISAQTEANKAISGIIDDIKAIEEFDSGITRTVNDIEDTIFELDDSIDELSADTNFKLAEIKQGFNAYTRYADMEFAHRNNVYTKQEIDDMFASGGTSGYATVEWVEEQGFLTEESGDTLYVRQDAFEASGDTLYVRKDEFDVYSGDVESALTDLSEAIVAVDEKVDNLSGETFSAITKVQDNLDKYSIYADSRFAHKDDVDSLVGGIEDEIQLVSGKVDTNKENISRCEDAIRARATIQALNETRVELQGEIDDLDNRKADKTDITALSAAIDSNTAAIATEKSDRMTEDRIINGRVDNLAERVQEAEDLVRSYDVRITNVENGLTQEIADREQQKIDLIGREDDPSTGDTIWAAKNKADEIYISAVHSANTYTDAKYDDLYGQFDELSAKTDTELSKFAKKDYVDRRFNDVKTVLRSEIATGVQSAMTYTDDEVAKVRENLDELDDFVRHPVSGLSVTVNKNSTILNAFTAWDGEGDYTDEGNGIIDVMHREIHDLKPEGIDELKAQVSANTDSIAENAQNIATNAQNIADEVTARETKDNELETKVNGSIKNIEFANGILTITKNDNTSFTIDLTSAGSGW